MNPTSIGGAATAAEAVSCWKTIGVEGDGSCEQLVAAVHCRNCPVFSLAAQKLFESAPPPDYLAAQTARYAAPQDSVAVGAVPLLLFRLADEWLGLEVGAVVEVAAPRVVHRIPFRSNELLRGIVNFRGELPLCVSLHHLLGMPTADADAANAPRGGTSRLLVCQHEHRRWAFPIDEAAGVERIDVAALGNVPTTVAKRAARLTEAVFPWRGGRAACLDADRLFSLLQRSIG
jgi:chemotaxis-related protein WspD